MKKGLLIFLSLISVAIAQNIENETLFTIAGDEVKVAEFKRVYTKNNINNQADFSKKSLDEYLDLYEKFRLKVKEAESLGMDTTKLFKGELASYRSQLTQSYLSDRKATKDLLDEAYNRMNEEVNVSHLLIFWPNAKPSKTDSLQVLKEIKKIKASAEKTSFDAQIAKYSKTNLTKYSVNKPKYESGKLGYITVFQTVYPFENAMYNTPVGKISEPVATRFGYHLVYVEDKRPARGKMETAHILVKSKETDSRENQEIAKNKAEQIYNELETGALNFEDAVKKYSEDKKTKYQSGKLPSLSGSEMIPSYADAAFALKKDGDFSIPIKTKIGWHIVKRLKKVGIPEFELAKIDLQKKIERDSRSNVAKELMINDTKRKFGYKENSNNNFFKDLSDSFEKGKFVLKNKEANEEVLFSIGESQLTKNDFLLFLNVSRQNRQNKNVLDHVENSYKIFQNQEITKYREDNLEQIDVDFKNLMQEYHDGILLFELTNKEVWNKAVEDTVGLKTFFENNRNKYVWKERVSYTTFTAKDQKTTDKLLKFLKKGKSTQNILTKLNKKEETLTSKNTILEKDATEFVKSLKWEKGSIAQEKNLNGSVKVVHVDKILQPENKELEETRGYVISDYQDYLENVWISKLRKKYPVKVNQDIFKALMK